MMYLQEILENPVRSYPDKIAITDTTGETITYRNLNALSNQLKTDLAEYGVSSGDRVGICLHKSIDAVVGIFAILRTGAAYVPVDPSSPPARNAYIFNDCLVKVILIEKDLFDSLCSEFKDFSLKVLKQVTNRVLLIEGPGSHRVEKQTPDEELAYILYTSGSTGKPKGVMYPHQGALSFVNWCSETFDVNQNDIFSSHAPFHFDLSIFDLYVSLKHGGTLILIGEETGKQPMLLAELISQKKISVWYSTPSVLTLLAKFGKMEKFDYSELRYVLFAGEVFPIKHLQAIKRIWKHPRFFNLYGPTETNVCTWYEIPAEIPEDQTSPFPIGKDCSHLICAMLDDHGDPVEPGTEGELCVTGPIMSGYWNLPNRNDQAFVFDRSGKRWYKTGDVVKQLADGNYIYISRKDRMVKRRGYRVELGEIEAALYKHPTVTEAAVIALQDTEGGILIKAFLNVSDKEYASIVKMKQFAVENLPSYMIPDRFIFLASLPKTSTDKTDYQKLKLL